jgi:ABC-type oligopeptide transport system ATPase subunit
MHNLVLQAESLTRVYRSSRRWSRREEPQAPPAVDRISLSISTGEILGVVGESGSGKSTLCRLLLRLEEPQAGTVRYSNEDLSHASTGTMLRFRRDVQAVFQNSLASLHPYREIGKSIAEPLAIHHPELSRNERQEQAAAALERVGLDRSLVHRRPAQLSGGQLQRICIARALILNPSLLIADEPITALDVSVQAQIVNLFLDLREQSGIGSIFVSHDLNMVRYLCDRVAVMYRGRMVESGPVARVFAEPLHRYTQELLAATPLPDPDHPISLRNARNELDRGYVLEGDWLEQAPGHFVLAANSAKEEA